MIDCDLLALIKILNRSETFWFSMESSLLQQTIFWERIRRTFLYRSLRVTYLYVSEFRLTLKHGSIQVQSKSHAYLDKIYAFDTSWPPEWMSTVLHFLRKRMEWLNIDRNIKKIIEHPCGIRANFSIAIFRGKKLIESFKIGPSH